jgi:cytochrome c oxidase subunit 2
MKPTKEAMRKGLLAAALLAALAMSPVLDRAQERPPDRRIEIVAERFSYSPSRIRVRRGMTVEFVLTSDDTYHGFFLPQFDINLMILPPGKDATTVRVTFAEAGEYVFECSRPCGAGHNTMRGVIVVEESEQ